MNTEDWVRAEELFPGLAQLGSEERAAALRELVEDSPRLRHELEGLLAAHDDSSGVLDELHRRFVDKGSA